MFGARWRNAECLVPCLAYFSNSYGRISYGRALADVLFGAARLADASSLSFFSGFAAVVECIGDIRGGA